MNSTKELQDQLERALGLECPREARRLAQPVAEAASEAGDAKLYARALAGLAEIDCLLCDYRESQTSGTRAARLLRELGDVHRESNALNTVARASSALGWNEAAVEAAFLSLELAKQTKSPRFVSEAYAELGYALTYSRSFEAAHAALTEAEDVARSCGSQLDELVALARQGNCEALRVVVHRHEVGTLPTLERAECLLKKFHTFKAKHDMRALAQPDQMPIQVFLNLVEALFLCWQGNKSEPRRQLRVTRDWMEETGVAPWMEIFAYLTACELALAEQDFESSEREALRMIQVAQGTGNQQALNLGHMLLACIYGDQGRLSKALREVKLIATLERQARIASLATRPEVVAWQLEMRRSEQIRQELLASTDQLTKLSMEDSLTGIANRRFFEIEAREALRFVDESTRPVCIALLDVDHFKQINDGHGHSVGDKVLQVIAALLVEHIRQEDLAARLAGDEFVILFRNQDARVAEKVCERLRIAVRAYDWNHLSSQLAVSVSIGVSQASAGDSLETLLIRSDAAMYTAKDAGRRILG